MMMLEAISPRRQRRIEMIATFTTDNQWPSGSWYYIASLSTGGTRATRNTPFSDCGPPLVPACEFPAASGAAPPSGT